MKTIIKSTVVLMLLCIALGYSGCGGENIKDTLLSGYQSFLQLTSKHALTKESELQGKKIKGGDAYVGSYTAAYEHFDGEEYIFGATGLERAAGNALTVTYTLKITSGSASVIWDHSGSRYALASVEGEGTHEVTLGTGDNYFVLKGEDFTGHLELEVI